MASIIRASILPYLVGSDGASTYLGDLVIKNKVLTINVYFSLSMFQNFGLIATHEIHIKLYYFFSDVFSDNFSTKLNNTFFICRVGHASPLHLLSKQYLMMISADVI